MQLISDVTLATATDEPEIREFIRCHWRADHIFVLDDSFFLFEMCPYGTPNFALLRAEGILVGILGFTQSSSLIRESDLFLVLFRALKTEGVLNPGKLLMDFVRGLTARNIHTIGANEKVIPYYRFLGFTVGLMDNLVWLNPEFREYFADKEIAIPSRKVPREFSVSDPSLFTVKSLNFGLHDIKRHFYQPKTLAKDPDFFWRRYSCHPYYEYEFVLSTKFLCIGVFRRQRLGNFTGIRVIDWVGDYSLLADFVRFLIDTASDQGIAYVDLYSTGFDTSNLVKAGLSKATIHFYAPNYHEPLVWKMVDLPFATSSGEVPVFFRGDCDQDRPSKVTIS